MRSSQAPDNDRTSSAAAPARGVDLTAIEFGAASLRGVGQVMLQGNACTGLLFLIGVAINDWVAALYGVLGTVVSTCTALAFRAPPGDIRRGLYGFNGTLTGIALAVLLPRHPALIAYVFGGAVFAAIVTAAIKDLFGAGGHALTAPFVLTTWFFVGAQPDFPQLGSHTVPVSYAAGSLTPAGVVAGILNGPAQVMLQKSIWTGIIFLLALAVASRKACIAGLVGSAIGFGVAYGLGASAGPLRGGLYGFNAVLTGIALSGIFGRLDKVRFTFAVIGAVASTVVYASLHSMLGRVGWPVLTSPFVATTWVCLIAGPAFTRLHTAPPPGKEDHHAANRDLVSDADSAGDGKAHHLPGRGTGPPAKITWREAQLRRIHRAHL